MFNAERFITDRLRAIDASGIRRVFDLGAELAHPINLSIGQPDFEVPDSIRQAAIQAIDGGLNSYTQTQGIAALRQRVAAQIAERFPTTLGDGDRLRAGTESLITSGVSGGLLLALMACVGPGDEVLIPDPYFVMYKHLVTLSGATPVMVDTYPDFQLSAERLDAYITPHSRLLLFNSPSNPTGVVATPEAIAGVVDLCERNQILMLSDEIYDTFCYEPVERQGRSALASPADLTPNLLLLKGFSKTYAMTGWRLGYAVGPAAILEQMTKLQQYSFVCAPSMVQAAGVTALGVDMSDHVAAYRRKRDRVVERLSPHYELTPPGGAFYAFPAVPAHLGIDAGEFVERAVARNVLVIPGSVFSRRDSHFRLSYACDDAMLEEGLDVLVAMAS